MSGAREGKICIKSHSNIFPSVLQHKILLVSFITTLIGIKREYQEKVSITFLSGHPEI
jgi:hypothetical protein